MTNSEHKAEEGRRDDRQVSRRAMLCWASGVAALAGTAPAGADPLPTVSAAADTAPGAKRLASPTSRRFSVGPIDAFVPGSRIAIDPLRVCVIRDGDRIAAISTTCAHLGCIVGAVEAGFACPCHGSRFDRTGTVIAGPAAAPLAWFQVRLMPSGELEVDTGIEVEPGTWLTV